MTGAPSGAKPRGLLARLRHDIGPLLPRFVRHAAARLLEPLEARRGGTYEIAGERLRFLPGSAPVVVQRTTDERLQLDALQLAIFAQAIRPGDVVADVGAYRGTYTLVAAARVGARGKIIAFEPTAANADLIAENVKLNRFQDRVHVENLAVSDRSGVTAFYTDTDSSTNSFWPGATGSDQVSVRTTSLDEYFADQQLPRVVKIDVEGAELAVLRGAHNILASSAVIVCELHPYAWSAAGYTAADLRELLAKHGRYAADPISNQEIEVFSYAVALLRRHD